MEAKITGLLLTTPNLNTKFFHLSTTIRRRRNSFEALNNGVGVWLQDREAIGLQVVDHFSRVYSSSSSVGEFEEISRLIEPVLNEDDNRMLCAMPSREEIQSVVSLIGALKALGPDGMLAVFYQNFWGTVNEDICATIWHFFNTGNLLRQLNRSFLVLIPKMENPSHIKHLRPISLCNITYKVISKILTIRLKAVITKLISPFQATHIQENINISQEILHSMKSKRGRKGLADLKLDMEKAYD